jgi:NH3-dependent NAD+ synthetase
MITDLKKEITLLAQKIDILMNIVNEEVSFGVREDRGTTDEVKVGDYVAITNNYKGMYGERGTVIQTTRTQVSIRLMSGLIVNRGKKNVKVMTCQ